jgi:hypothetical protein
MMKAVLLDIGDQMHLCAALMSDPELLCNQPHVVASQFKVAASRIEQLKAFLEKPTKAVSADKPWFDKTVLDGVYKLVDVTLRRHLRPLNREYKFPLVFKHELEELHETTGQHLLIREIRETNCVGAMIVLYYLLYWHLALILLNRRHHPACYADLGHGDDDEDGFDFEGLLLSKLPRREELLELRRFGDDLINTAYKEDPKSPLLTKTLNSDLFDFVDPKALSPLKKRHTPAMNVLRKVIDFPSAGDETARSDISKSIHSLLGLCISAKLDLLAGVVSTFDLQDDVEKWEDMYRSFQIQSNAEDGAGFAQYSYRLVNALKTPPYSDTPGDFKDKAMRAAVYDYGSVALMTDISKSFIALARLVKVLQEDANDEDVFSGVAVLIAQVYERNDQHVRDELGRNELARRDDTDYHRLKFIQHTPGWKRAECKLQDGYRLGSAGPIVIDQIAGHYWGARPSDLDQFNHQYLACPTLDIDPQTGSNMLSRLQALSDSKNVTHRAAFSCKQLTTLHRNSLYVLTLCKTLTKVVDIFKPFLRGAKIILDPSYLLRPDRREDPLWVESTLVRGMFDASEVAELKKVVAGKKGKAFAVTITELQKRLNRETAALRSCIEQARSEQSQKFPGISWPVTIGEDGNFNVFERIHAIPRATPSLPVSVDGIHDLMKAMNNGRQMLGHEQMAELIRGAAKKAAAETTPPVAPLAAK